MKTKIILRLSKSIVFIIGLIVYGFLKIQNPKSWWATLFFGFVLGMYLIELHKDAKMKLQEAIKILIINLRKDKEFYYGWQSNIAMIFKDYYYNYKEKKNKRWLNQKDLHKIANESAKNFLDLLIRRDKL